MSGNDIRFNGREHLDFYTGMVLRTNAERDPYRKALFYTLGVNQDTRQHINDLYDFDDCGIKTEGLEKGWQTSGSLRVSCLAFNLYNGFTDDSWPVRTTPYYLFDSPDRPYLLEAVKIRFGEE